MADSRTTTLYALLTAAAAAGAASTVVCWHLLNKSKSKPKSKSESSSNKPTSSQISHGVTELIGNTPLIRINSLSDRTGCEILGKAEFLNPGGSSKDRIALYLIEQAELRGELHPNANNCIFEGTSGSTGISLAMVARAKGYLCHIVMPSDQAVEKSQLLQRYGATVERVPPCSIVDKGHFVNVARQRAAEHTGGAYFVDQFENLLNAQAHYEWTGPEIWAQVRGRMDAFVHGSGTGGTIAGVARYLKEQNPRVRCYLADPQGSGLANKVNHGVMFADSEREGTRRRQQVDTLVEGVGLNRMTRNFARLFSTTTRRSKGGPGSGSGSGVADADAVRMARWLVAEDGLFVGSSAAINCVAAVRVAKMLGPGHTVVTVLADGGQRHLTKFWSDEAMTGLGHDVQAPASLDEFLG
ncbi:Cysteine synthase 2 [Kickxella alabastrina]|uniref:Cysteine synthase 2 n=1 Tax=Kickxella alabastrina TaxID=61397 RepID=A0ACC1IBR4_9FUNG|nr:Cysteine synthase 2 [Kickxella alabastrina]